MSHAPTNPTTPTGSGHQVSGHAGALTPVKRPQDLTPRAIVEELDRYIVGQKAAKRAVAVALRNRWRRQQVPPPMRDEIAPKNIMLIGPTGVGKTEIARRLARLAGAPFVKVEASKFTEVGYVGRDVDSMVRDLAETAVSMLRDEERERLRPRARDNAEERLLDVLLPPAPRARPAAIGVPSQMPPPPAPEPPSDNATRESLRKLMREGKLDDKMVEIDTADSPASFVDVFSGTGMEEMVLNLRDMLPQGARKTKRRRLPLPEALEVLTEEEANKLIDVERLQKDAIRRAEQSGIIFIDEIDKVAGREGGGHGPDVSREGVQRDLLPIVEGSTVSTKYGPLKTDHVLFIAAGAFHVAKPKDMIPELQGRFPIRVELESLSDQDFVRILTEPENALTKQYTALLATEKVTLEIHDDAVAEIARIATEVNARMENIGARRLHTIMERVLDDLAFEAPALGQTTIPITAAYVRERLDGILKDEDLSQYIL
ncbi:MAG TPA: ATP-dependent protease ATPase subunit HslU [Polyangia bacterium]|jgi:ATP-dependent HslUV protease ATP-binding subunit HslU|nr:ATP-dependent protease ATPase subunit HslU [Polyangia bacterium]